MAEARIKLTIDTDTEELFKKISLFEDQVNTLFEGFHIKVLNVSNLIFQGLSANGQGTPNQVDQTTDSTDQKKKTETTPTSAGDTTPDDKVILYFRAKPILVTASRAEYEAIQRAEFLEQLSMLLTRPEQAAAIFASGAAFWGVKTATGPIALVSDQLFGTDITGQIKSLETSWKNALDASESLNASIWKLGEFSASFTANVAIGTALSPAGSYAFAHLESLHDYNEALKNKDYFKLALDVGGNLATPYLSGKLSKGVEKGLESKYLSNGVKNLLKEGEPVLDEAESRGVGAGVDVVKDFVTEELKPKPKIQYSVSPKELNSLYQKYKEVEHGEELSAFAEKIERDRNGVPEGDFPGSKERLSETSAENIAKVRKEYTAAWSKLAAEMEEKEGKTIIPVSPREDIITNVVPRQSFYPINQTNSPIDSGVVPIPSTPLPLIPDKNEEPVTRPQEIPSPAPTQGSKTNEESHRKNKDTSSIDIETEVSNLYHPSNTLAMASLAIQFLPEALKAYVKQREQQEEANKQLFLLEKKQTSIITAEVKKREDGKTEIIKAATEKEIASENSFLQKEAQLLDQRVNKFFSSEQTINTLISGSGEQRGKMLENFATKELLGIDLSGKNKLEAIKKWLLQQLISLAASKWAEAGVVASTEAAKTGAAQTGFLARAAIFAGDIGKSLASAAASAFNAAVSVVEWISKIIPFPFSLAVIPAGIAGIYGLYQGAKKLFKFKDGGITQNAQMFSFGPGGEHTGVFGENPSSKGEAFIPLEKLPDVVGRMVVTPQGKLDMEPLVQQVSVLTSTVAQLKDHTSAPVVVMDQYNNILSQSQAKQVADSRVLG